ncbi:hypothetical protein QLQ12_45955 [Actinoplanes sp. NEAU-A12]|uniref:Uncharacterized protein n=1 Tax=Actinoplanes sandaracinus TaxID=3045177 RepID=A0ABT6X1R8_9ACTN|nr:hypothetical protein [Actinoplanes sandaracinus]MDI6105939.1 hypothetical protein [Actinoplanes sandaracinus]
MPRKRPGAIRATQQAIGRTVRQWTCEGGGPIDHLSLATTAAVRAVEHGGSFGWYVEGGECYDPDPFNEHIRPGRTAHFLVEYRKFLRQPGRKLRLEASLCPSCPGCQYDDLALMRDALEAVTRLLPLSARAEMRRLLSCLDGDLRRRTLPDSSPRTSWNGEPLPWWHRRIYKN